MRSPQGWHRWARSAVGWLAMRQHTVTEAQVWARLRWRCPLTGADRRAAMRRVMREAEDMGILGDRPFYTKSTKKDSLESLTWKSLATVDAMVG